MSTQDLEKYQQYLNKCSSTWSNMELCTPDTEEVSDILKSHQKTKERDKSVAYEYSPDLFGDGHIEEPSHRHWFIDKKYYPQSKEKKLKKLLKQYVNGSVMEVEFFFEEDLF